MTFLALAGKCVSGIAAPAPVLVPPTVGAALDRPAAIKLASAAAPTALAPRAKNWRRGSRRTKFSKSGCMGGTPGRQAAGMLLYTADAGSAVLLANGRVGRIMEMRGAAAGPF